MIPRTIFFLKAAAILLLLAISTSTSVRGFLAPTATLRNGVTLSMVAMDIQAGEQDATSRITKRTREQRLEAATKGLQVNVLGLSIHHAEVVVRERLAIPEAQWTEAAAEIVDDGSIIAEAAVLSTCNRFEVYYTATNPRPAMAALTKYLSERSGLPVATLRQNLFVLSGDDCVEHLLRVSGGLDSLVVGEGQILSQVRQCFMHANSDEGSGGKVLSRLLNTAVSAGKRVRSETAISKGSVSISSAAVELSEMFSQPDLQLPFSEARLAVIGSGKMTRLLITHLASRGLKAITIVNRSRARPQELADQFPDVDIDIKLMEDMWDVIAKSDIVYTATSSEVPIIDSELIRANGIGSRLMIVDISVPRNVHENTKSLSNVAAYNVDDLKAVVAKNTALRQKEMLEAEGLLKQEATAFSAWRESLSAIPTINQLQERANSFRQEELKKCTKKLSHLNDKELEHVERLSRGIVNKLLHGPMAHLRQTKSMEGKQVAVKELNAMFRLDDEGAAAQQEKRRRK